MFDQLKISTKDKSPLKSFSAELSRLGYEAVADSVQEAGEYCIRGNLVDCYPIDFRNPIRIEINPDDEIESIRDFTLVEGRTLQQYPSVTLLPIPEFYKEKRKIIRDAGAPLQHFKELRRGDLVVHLQYGIGKFLGLKGLQVKGKKAAHLAIEYAGGEILYVDTATAHLVERYIGTEGRKPKLHKLNGKEWSRTKEKVKKAVGGVARELIELQAKRSIAKGHSFKKDTEWQKQFEDDFPYEETKDQIKALADVKQDMESERPMDRLLCGDVGYGKTEVAMRAAFKAVMGGKQVAMLVPTTILAEQHTLTFQQRVRQFPVRVEGISRFRSKGEQSEILEHLKDGSCDIVIGTHRLLSKDVKFKDLGLVVIDEEQRFGVHHKEKLKHLRTSVDVLTLTATPIPRTLYLSLIGVRDMSAIQTPPKNRMPIITELLEYSDQRIQKAILNEVNRGGQIYFVHNRVQSILKIYDTLHKLMPTVRFEVAHGQLPAKQLESIMMRFMKGEIDCLIATNIVESGLDIPNVNTIIVNRADMFGLADLYQLRGRVGRMGRQAFAHFVIPKQFVLSEDAMKRLDAIIRFTELGSGFRIALQDLEIRGAGNILGHEQSGFIFQVGFDLYCRLLKGELDQINRKR